MSDLEHEDQPQQDAASPPPPAEPVGHRIPPPMAAPSPRRGLSAGCWLGLILAFSVLGMFLLFARAVSSLGGGAPATGRDHIALLRWQGVIGDVQVGLLGMGSSVDGFIKQLEQAARRDSARAIVLRIDSPGGSAAASQELYESVLRTRQRKPVVVSMGDTAASGGYYVAAAASRIVANPATMTGSIGVIMSGYNLQELMDRLGVDPQTITSGPHKDILSFERALTPEEKRILEEMVGNVYQQFLRDVAKGRGMKVEELKPLADGRIYTGEQAFEKGLVDELGGLRRAVELAAEMAGLSGEPVVVEYSHRTPLEQWLGVRWQGMPAALQGWRPLLVSRVRAPLLLQ